MNSLLLIMILTIKQEIFKNVLPFGEGDEYEYEEKQGAPDYSLTEEDTLLEKEIPPDPGDEVLPGEKPQRWHSAPDLPSYSEVFPKHQKKEPESVELSTLEKFLRNNKGDPDAKFETKKSKFFSWDKTQVEIEVFRIYAERAKKVLQKKSIGKKKMGPFTGKSRKEIRLMLGMEGKKNRRNQADAIVCQRLRTRYKIHDWNWN